MAFDLDKEELKATKELPCNKLNYNFEKKDPEEIKKMIEEINKNDIYKPIQKIKMKKEFYNKVVQEVKKNIYISEVLDETRQPLNRIYGVRIEIDDDIKKAWEVCDYEH